MFGAAPHFRWRQNLKDIPSGGIESGTLADGQGRPVSVSAARQRLEAGVPKLVLTLGRSARQKWYTLLESHPTVLCCSLFNHEGGGEAAFLSSL